MKRLVSLSAEEVNAKERGVKAPLVPTCLLILVFPPPTLAEHTLRRVAGARRPSHASDVLPVAPPLSPIRPAHAHTHTHRHTQRVLLVYSQNKMKIASMKTRIILLAVFVIWVWNCKAG